MPSMDIELLRTFVEVYRCRHFGKAAERLYVTQSAVSARIRQLETSLGCQLLARERKQVLPTAAGERFLAHAESLLQQWERARRDMSESAANGAPLRIGAVPALWDARGMRWLSTWLGNTARARVRVESRESEHLVQRLVEGALDLVLQFDVPRRSDVEHRAIGELRLVLAATDREAAFPGVLEHGYIELDWGLAFAGAQSGFMEGRVARLKMDSMHAALAWLRGNPGAAYLPEAIVEREAQLYPAHGAPPFAREIHACWLRHSTQRERVESFLAIAAT